MTTPDQLRGREEGSTGRAGTEKAGERGWEGQRNEGRKEQKNGFNPSFTSFHNSESAFGAEKL